MAYKDTETLISPRTKELDKNGEFVVYQIRNIDTNETYIGSSGRLFARTNTHASNLRRGKHPNLGLQESFNNSASDFTKFVVEVIADGFESKAEARAYEHRLQCELYEDSILIADAPKIVSVPPKLVWEDYLESTQPVSDGIKINTSPIEEWVAA